MVNRWERIATAIACASLFGFAACGGRNGNNRDTTATTAAGDVARSDSAAGAVAPGAAAAQPGSTAAGSTAAGSTAGAASSMRITGGDPEILQVLAVVDQSEVQDGKLAQQKARSSQVKTFARELISDHTKSLEKDRQVAKSAGIDLSGVMMSGSSKTTGSGATKTGSDTSRSSATSAAQSSASGPSGATGLTAELVNAHTQMMDQVRQQQGAAFDSAFVSAQVQGHQQVLALLQSAQAQNSALQQHVTAAIKDVQSHLEKGQQLQQSLSSGTSGSSSDTTSKSKSKTDTTKRG